MEPDPPELPAALLRWINTFDFAATINSWKDIQDGEILWRILADIDADYFSGALPEPDASNSDNWIPRWQNLKQIDRMAILYIRDTCGRFPNLSKEMSPDLKAIAIDASMEDSAQLAKVVLLAGLFSETSNQRITTAVTELGAKLASSIAIFINNMEQREMELADADSHMDIGSDAEGMASPERSGTPGLHGLRRDPELEREEQLIKAYSVIKDLEEKIATLEADLNEAKARSEKAESELSDIKYRLEHGGSLGVDGEALEELKQKSAQDSEYIAELESELGDYKSSAENQEKQLERLKVDSESKKRLRDELQLLKVERDDLLQKSKASENLKKKIQSLQESDKGNQTVRQDLEAAQEELQKMRQFKDRCAALQKANEENMKTIANGEQEIFDQKTTRKRLDHEIKFYAQRWEAAKERQQRDADIINELEERIRDLDAGQGKVTQDLGSLDDEVSTKDKIHNDLKARIEELESENSRLKEAPTAKEDHTGVSQEAHEHLQSRYDKIEKKYLDAYQENLGLDATLKHANQETIDSRPYVELRDRFRAEESRRIAGDKRIFDLETEAGDMKAKLNSVESKLAGMDRDKADVPEQAKQLTADGASMWEQDKSRILDRAKNFEFELEEARSLLRHALLDRYALSKDDPELRSRDAFKLIVDELHKFKKENVPSEEELASSLTQRIEQGLRGIKDAEEKTLQVRASLESQLESLRSRLNKAEEEVAKGVTTPLQENIQRELSLMTSAWYDMTSRIQSDAVIVQRRSEAPRSFLNRQRRLLGSPVVPVSQKDTMSNAS